MKKTASWLLSANKEEVAYLCTQRPLFVTVINLVNYAGINLLLGGGLNYFHDFVMYLQIFYLSSGKLSRYKTFSYP